MTKRTISIFCLSLCAMLGAASAAEPGWTTLFDGKSLDGWRASETKSTFKLVDGALVAHGTRSHLFYVGDVNGGSFENFELKVDVMTKNNSNGGIYFHTEYHLNYAQSGYPLYSSDESSYPWTRAVGGEDRVC